MKRDVRTRRLRKDHLAILVGTPGQGVVTHQTHFQTSTRLHPLGITFCLCLTQIPNHVSTRHLGSVRVRARKGPLQSWRLVGKPGRSAHRGPRPAAGLQDATHPPIPPGPRPGPLPAPREFRGSSADSRWGRHPRTCCQGSAPDSAPPPPAARDLLPRPAPPHGLPRAQPDPAEIPEALVPGNSRVLGTVSSSLQSRPG